MNGFMECNEYHNCYNNNVLNEVNPIEWTNAVNEWDLCYEYWLYVMFMNEMNEVKEMPFPECSEM